MMLKRQLYNRLVATNRVFSLTVYMPASIVGYYNNFRHLPGIMLHPILSDRLLEFKTCIQFGGIYAFISFCFITIIAGTKFTLDAENYAASNTGKKFTERTIAFSLAAYILPALFLLYYNKCRNLNHSGCMN